MQINVMSQALKLCFGSINPYTITIIATLLLIFYSMFGGVRAVAYTDVLQFITFSMIIPLLAWFMFLSVNKPVYDIIPIIESQTKFQFSNLLSFNTQVINMFLLSLSFLVPYGSPGIMQRIYMASGPIQAKQVFTYTTFFSFIINLFIILTSLFVFAGAPDLATESIWDYIIVNIPPIFKGFLAIGLLSMAISTADSSLNACSVIFTNDIVQVIQSKTEIPDPYKLKIARGTTLVIGLLAMLIAFKYTNLLKLLYWSVDCSRPLISAPFVLGLFGFRGTTRTALIGMATGLFSILAWNQWINFPTGMNGAFIAMLANSLAMMAAHYLLKQPDGTGWVKPDNTFKEIQCLVPDNCSTLYPSTNKWQDDLWYKYYTQMAEQRRQRVAQ